MNKLDFLKEKYSSYPTIMDIKDEMKLVEELTAIPENIIHENLELFFDLLIILEDSHQNGGIFEVTDDSLCVFIDFSIWLRKINLFFKLDRIEISASDFEIKFDS